jgi:hypothetical protein
VPKYPRCTRGPDARTAGNCELPSLQVTDLVVVSNYFVRAETPGWEAPKGGCRTLRRVQKSDTPTRTHFLPTFSLLRTTPEGAKQWQESQQQRAGQRPHHRYADRRSSRRAAGCHHPEPGQCHRVPGWVSSNSRLQPFNRPRSPCRCRYHPACVRLGLCDHRVPVGDRHLPTATFTLPTCSKAIDEVTWEIAVDPL